jgi:hypothetical protein
MNWTGQGVRAGPVRRPGFETFGSNSYFRIREKGIGVLLDSGPMTKPRLNEERGARRAAALKSRFRKVSDRSFGRTGIFRASEPASTVSGSGMRSGSLGKSILIWLAIGVAAYSLGTLLT